MSDSPFAQPSAGGDKFEPKDYNGKLLLLYAKSYNGSEATKFGETSSADADIIVVDHIDPSTGKPLVLFNARVFGNLANSVRNDIGRVVLGRLGQGPNTKGNPPWILLNHTDADAQLAGPVHQQYQAGLFKPAETPPPQPPAAPPGHDPWAGVNATPAPPAAAVAPTDPNIAFLMSKGVPYDQIMAMDPGNRQLLANSFPK